MDMEVVAEVTVYGKKGRVGMLRPNLADGYWSKQDEISVWIDFSPETVAGALGFGVSIPVKDYTPEEFVKVVTGVVNKRVGEMEAERAKEKDREADSRGRAERINAVIERLKNRTGGSHAGV